MSMFSSKTPVTIEPPAPAAPAIPVSGLPGGPGGNSDPDTHLLDRLSVIYRYRNIAIAVLMVVLIGGAVQTYTTTKEYRSVATVQIDPDRPAVAGIGQALFQDDEMYAFATELSRLRSHRLARRVATRLDLKNNPEFNGSENAPTGLGDAMLSLRQRLTASILMLMRGTVPEPVAIPKGMEAAAAQSDKSAEDLAEPAETPEEAALVEALAARRTVRESVGSRIVSIEVISRHPEFAAAAANAFAREYVNWNFETKTREIRLQRENLERQAARTKEELENMKKFYQTAIEQSPTGMIDAGSLMGIVAQTRNAWQNAQVTTATAKTDYEDLAKVDVNDPNAVTNVQKFASDPQVSQYLSEIRNLESQKNRLKQTEGLAENNTRMLALTSDITGLLAQIKARLSTIVDAARSNYQTAQSAEEKMRESYDQQSRLASSQSKNGIGLSFVQEEIKIKTDNYNNILKQVDEASIQESGTTNNVRLLETAQVPRAPFKPDAARNMLTALLIGLVLALALSFGLDYLDDTVKTPEDITRKLHVPFLGLVPSVRGDKPPVLSEPVPHDFGESYRALRTSLVFTSGSESTRVITVTSAQPLEGKTTTACNLAMVLAFGGSRVLLVDADMRRPGIHKALKINNTVGLSHLLVGQARVREAIQRTSDPNFCVMTAGRTPPNPSELLSSERMRQLVTNLKQGPFDWVVIDTPPVLAVTDAVILTPLVDGVNFVVGAEMTRRRLAERAVNMIMASRPKVVGAVLNRVNFDRNKYYYSRYYGYQYKNYYGPHSSTITESPANR